MIALLISILMTAAFADPVLKWSTAIEVTELHEFFNENKMISQPAGTWQTLFGIRYMDANLQVHKDCAFYRIPQKADGIFKIKTISSSKKCEDFLFEVGDKTWSDLRALQLEVGKKQLSLFFTFNDFKTQTWDISLLNTFKKIPAELQMSSAGFRSSKIIFLTPQKVGNAVVPEFENKIKDGYLCHPINDECQELGPSECAQCPQGWFEKPNGCLIGPKVCGISMCGQKHQVACRRGTKYQRVRKRYDCRIDDSFAYCADGLKISCEGAIPYCI
jgi:hypothetical protein